MAFKNYYEVLGISSTATPDEIRRRYLFLAKRWHSDLNRENEESKNRDYADEKLKEINQAHDVLKDPIQRAAHDRDLRLKEEQERREENEQTQSEPMDAEWERVDEEDDKEASYGDEFYRPPPRTPIAWIHWYSTKTVAARLMSFKLKSGSNLEWILLHYTGVVTAHLERLKYNRPTKRNPIQWGLRSAAESAVLLVGLCLIALLLITTLSFVFEFLSSFDTIKQFHPVFILCGDVLGLLAARLAYVTRKRKPFFRRGLKEYALLSVVITVCFAIASIVSFLVIIFAFNNAGYGPNEINRFAFFFFINLIGLYASYLGYRAMSPRRGKVTLPRLIAGFGVIVTLLVMGFAVPTVFYRSSREVEHGVNSNTPTPSLPVNSNNSGNSNTSTDPQSSDNPTFETLNPTVTYIKFFESGSSVPLRENRQYATSFSQSGTRFMHWELGLEHPAPNKRVDYIVKEVWYRQDGRVEGRHTEKSYIDEG